MGRFPGLHIVVSLRVLEVVHACTELVGSHHLANSSEAINRVRTGSVVDVCCSFQYQFYAFLCFLKVSWAFQHYSVSSDCLQGWAVFIVSPSYIPYSWSHWLVGSWHMTKVRLTETNKTQFQVLYLTYRGIDPLSGWKWVGELQEMPFWNCEKKSENGTSPEKAELNGVVWVVYKASSEARITPVTCSDTETMSALLAVAPAWQ